jgi:hypothetical protein
MSASLSLYTLCTGRKYCLRTDVMYAPPAMTEAQRMRLKYAVDREAMNASAKAKQDREKAGGL